MHSTRDKNKTARVCPLTCERGYKADSECCVNISCAAGSIFPFEDQGVRRRKLVQKVAFWIFILASSRACAGTVLITEQEASLPAERVVLGPRGITRGPRIELVQPGETSSSPMRFQLKFQSFGGARINTDSLRVTYLKIPEIDITPRVRPFAHAAGIDIPDAEIPTGEHYIRAEVKDSEGRVKISVFVLKVTP